MMPLLAISGPDRLIIVESIVMGPRKYPGIREIDHVHDLFRLFNIFRLAYLKEKGSKKAQILYFPCNFREFISAQSTNFCG